MNSNSNIPSIGQIVHYHPDDHTRLAALVIEVHAPPEVDADQSDYGRPALDLIVFQTNGKQTLKSEVQPVDLDDIEADKETLAAQLADRWTFADEIAILQEKDVDPDQVTGTNSNRHVGDLV